MISKGKCFDQILNFFRKFYGDLGAIVVNYARHPNKLKGT